MRIAIVTPYTLLNLGLKHLLQKYFDTTPILYNEISEFFDNAPEQFDAYILFADTIIGYSDFFLPRKSKIILLASEGSHLPETSMTSLDIHESEESLLEKIQHRAFRQTIRNPASRIIASGNRSIEAGSQRAHE